MPDHSRLSPSGASRWMACPGAPEAEAGQPDKSSVYAQQGSGAHELAERCLLDGREPEDLIGEPLPETGWIPDGEMAGHVAEYVGFVRRMRGVLEVERTLDLSPWLGGDSKGTPDAVSVGARTLTVVDLKYGMGKVVHPQWNRQLMIYALGALDEYAWIADPERVRLVIHQPRLDAVTEWVVTARNLREWGAGVLKPAVKAASRPGAARVPGEEQCRWCRASGDCSAQRQAAEAAVLAMLGDDPPDPEGMSDEDLSKALSWRKLVEVWFKGVEERARAKVENGGLPGWKLVRGRGSRVWEEGRDDAVIDLLGDEAWIRKLVSPAQAEKALGKDRRGEIKDWIAVQAGKPTLAPEDDRRPAITATAEDFD